jgi:hypothetical protein
MAVVAVAAGRKGVSTVAVEVVGKWAEVSFERTAMIVGTMLRSVAWRKVMGMTGKDNLGFAVGSFGRESP